MAQNPGRFAPIAEESREASTMKAYDATVELGVPVTLIDAVVEDEDGGVEIPQLDALLATVAVARALAPVQLVGREIRFLRHVLDATGAAFAGMIGLDDKTVVSRWENDRVRPGGFTEKVIRQLVLNELGDRAPGVEIDRNAIPGMRIRRRDVSEGPLPMVLTFGRSAGSADGPMVYGARAA